MKKVLPVIFLFVPGLIFLNAQSRHWKCRGGVQLSHLVVHTPKLAFMPTGPGLTADISVSRKVSPRYYPLNSENLYSGLMVKYLFLGRPSSVLGNALGAVLYYDFRHQFRSRLCSYFLVGTGMSYNDRIYDLNKNPNQNAVSIKFNNLTTFEWRLEYPLNPSVRAYAGLSLSHISNGSFQSPNLGLNYLSLILGLQHGSDDQSDVRAARPSDFRKWMISVNYGMAFREEKVIGGPKFRIDNLTAEAGRYYKPLRLIKAGFDAEYHQLTAYFAERSEIRPNIASARNISYRLYFFTGHEWTFGPTTLETRMGYQLLNNAILAGIPLYVKLIFQYQHVIPGMSRLFMNAGIALKAHYGNAEYISLFTGLRFRY